MTYFYAASTNAFYPEGMRSTYEEAGSWPADAKEVSDDVFATFAAGEVPEGKIRIAGPDGMPAWGDIPPPSEAEIEAAALAKRAALLREAASHLAPLQDAVDLEVATDAEKAALRAWKVYRVELNRIESQPGYPLTVVWPEPPDM